MRIIAGIAIVVLVLAGAAFVFMQYFYVYPLEVAKAYVNNIVSGDYQELEAYYHTGYPSPSALELETAFKQFADEYGLTAIELVGINAVDETLKNAEYVVDLRYESKFFEPLFVQFKLPLARDGLLSWKVKWTNVLPVPAYGINATYKRTRIEPVRGSIYDQNGSLLAGKGSVITVGVQPGRISDPDLLYQVLEENLGLSPDYVQRQYQAPGIQEHWFVPLATVTEGEYQTLDPILRPVPGVFFQRQQIRAYPATQALAHVTGYMGEVSPQIIEQFPDREYLAGESVGRSGLEFGLEEKLRGIPGYRLFVTTEETADMMFLERPVTNGEDVHLTIDLRMQQLAYNVLSDLVGSFIVLDATSGEVLVLTASPSYDPNEFIMGISSKRWQELSTDPSKPLFNRSLQGRFPPGSVFKVITAAAALDQNIFTTESVFQDTGELRVEGNIIRNFQQEVFDEHRFADGIIKSINTTMARVGLEVGADILSQYFAGWRLDTAPKLNLEAVPGQIGNPGRSKVSLAWTAIGQDQVLLTPFHVASIFTVFANEGVLPEFHLVKAELDDNSMQVIQPETALAMEQLLEQVVLAGTGRAAAVEGLKICGKTGTAETGTESSHAWFGGYVKDFNGRNLAFSVLVEGGGIGGQTAAPLIREFFQRLGEF